MSAGGRADAMAGLTQPWRAQALAEGLQPLCPGLRVEVLPSVDSTNSLLLERARAGDTRPVLLVAEQQTAGRGRLGRPWWSAPGTSLTMSLGLAYDPVDWSGVSLAVGLAAALALDPKADVGIGLKWPNDLWMRDGDRKLAGILVETLPMPAGSGRTPGERWTVFGIGINVRPMPGGEAPEAGAFRTGYACTQEFWPEVEACTVLERVAPVWLTLLDRMAREGLAGLLPAFAARDVLRGRRVAAGEVQGMADGFGPDGALRIRCDDGRVVSVNSGEVSVRPC